MPERNFLQESQTSERTAQRKWDDVTEEHQAIADSVRDFIATLDAARQLARSTLAESERIAALLTHYAKMRELAHRADIYISRAAECLTIEAALKQIERKS